MTSPNEPDAAANKRAQLARLLADAATPVPKPGPLSYGQRGLWFLYRSNPASAAYHFVSRARINSDLDYAAFATAFAKTVQHHPLLRCRIIDEHGEPQQLVDHAHEPNFRHIAADNWTDTEIESAIDAATSEPFDLVAGPAYRAVLYSRAHAADEFVLVVHHIFYDAISAEVFVADLGNFYADSGVANASTAATGNPSFQRFVEWQRDFVASDAGEAQREYWVRELGGELPVLDLPTDFQRPPQRRYNGASVPLTFSADRVRGLQALARQLEVNVYTIVVTLFHVLLHRYSAQDETLVGIPALGRTRPEFARTLGYFVNTVVVRARPGDDLPFSELVAATRKTLVNALANQDYPFSLLVEKLQPDRDTSRNPVFQAMVDWQRSAGDKQGEHGDATADTSVHMRLGNLDIDALVLLPQQEGQVDLALDVKEMPDRLLGNLKYDADLFEQSTAMRMQDHLQCLIDAAIRDPEQRLGSLTLITESERQRILYEWNDTALPVDETPLHALIDKAAATYPEHAAVAFDGKLMSYRELVSQANQLAAYLAEIGVEPGSAVAIYVARNIDLMVALLGILKAGGAYVPLDPVYPPDRLQYMLENSGATVILTEENLAAGVADSGCRIVRMDSDRAEFDRQNAANPAVRTAPEDLAYIIYTSGSTGVPKGVEIPHRAVTNFLQAMRAKPGIAPQDRLLAVTTISFDIHVLELFLPLIAGACVEIASAETSRNGPALLDRLQRGDITVMQATPTTWQMLLDSGWQQALDIKLLCGGEALPRELANRLCQLGASLWNMYGPTEATVWTSTDEVRAEEEKISIGRPLANTSLFVLDRHHEPLPIGVIGELFIGGRGLAKGYHALPSQTAERFIDVSFGDHHGERLYRSGDTARYLADGRIEVLGRTDHQVKLRGFRIELGEIEAVLVRHPDIRSAVAIVRADEGEEPRLVAYVISNDDRQSSSELRASIRASLPEYMVPSEFVFLDEFPLTDNGKINRNALPAPDRSRAPDAPDEGEPDSELERGMAAIWRDVLNLEDIRAYDMFYDLGGHSLLSLNVVDRFEKEFGFRMDPEELVTQTLRQAVARFANTGDDAAAPDDNKRGLFDKFKTIVSNRR